MTITTQTALACSHVTLVVTYQQKSQLCLVSYHQWAYALRPSRWTMGAIAGGPLGRLEAGRAPFLITVQHLSTGSAM